MNCKVCGKLKKEENNKLNDNEFINRNLDSNRKNKLLAALLGVFLGGLGIHRFYLGYIKIGILQLVLWFLGYFTSGVTWIITQIWGIIEGVMILLGKLTDAEGNSLK